MNDLYKRFKTEKDCQEFLEGILWKNGPVCPYCQKSVYTKLKTELRYHCNKCNNTFSVTVGTLFHKTRCDLRKWVLSIYLLMRSSIPITARGLAEQIDTTKDTAWLIISKIASSQQENVKLFGEIVQYLEKPPGKKGG